MSIAAVKRCGAYNGRTPQAFALTTNWMTAQIRQPAMETRSRTYRQQYSHKYGRKFQLAAGGRATFGSPSHSTCQGALQCMSINYVVDFQRDTNIKAKPGLVFSLLLLLLFYIWHISRLIYVEYMSMAQKGFKVECFGLGSCPNKLQIASDKCKEINVKNQIIFLHIQNTYSNNKSNIPATQHITSHKKTHQFADRGIQYTPTIWKPGTKANSSPNCLLFLLAAPSASKVHNLQCAFKRRRISLAKNVTQSKLR